MYRLCIASRINAGSVHGEGSQTEWFGNMRAKGGKLGRGMHFQASRGGEEMRVSSGKWRHLPLCCASAPGADSTSSAAAIITAHGLNQLAPAAPIRLCAPEGAWLDIFAAKVIPLVILVVGNGYPAPEPPQRSQHAALRPVSRRRLFNPEDQFTRKSLNYRRLAALSASEMGQLAASPRWPTISTRPRPSSPLSPPSGRGLVLA
jgi:hypothetical protein